MGHTKFECALYVMCRGDKQKKELTKRFEEEHPGHGRLFIWDSHKSPNRIDFAFSTGDFTSDLDDDILAIAEWLRTNFKLEMQGYCLSYDSSWSLDKISSFVEIYNKVTGKGDTTEQPKIDVLLDEQIIIADTTPNEENNV